MDSKIFISSSSSPDTSSPPPLLRLSNELLDTIFAIIYASRGNCASTRKPVCRRLLPYQRVQLYRHVHIQSYKALKSFHCTIVSSSTCARLVRHLFVTMWSVRNADGAVQWRSEPGDDESVRKLVTPVDFAALVPRLIHLESFTASRMDPSLLDVVFLNQAASSRLESLKRLDFSHPCDSIVQSGCDVDAWLQRLACLPRLADLSLVQPYGAHPILPDMAVPPTFPRLTRLVLEQGTLGDQHGWGPALDQMAPSLIHLDLRARRVGWFASALATAPVGLRFLSLVNRDEYHDEEEVRAPIKGVLARFKNLEQLFLCRCAFDASVPSGLADLIVLDKLVRLSFDVGCILPDSFLLALLANPSHLPNLKILELNHVESSRGCTVAGQLGAIPPFEEREDYPHWPMWDDWTEPEYPESSTEQGLLAVVQAARARGIVVRGATCDALSWRTAFETEQRVALLALGDLTGEYRRAREALGADAVNAHILARSLEFVDGGESGGEGGEGGEA